MRFLNGQGIADRLQAFGDFRFFARCWSPVQDKIIQTDHVASNRFVVLSGDRQQNRLRPFVELE